MATKKKRTKRKTTKRKSRLVCPKKTSSGKKVFRSKGRCYTKNFVKKVKRKSAAKKRRTTKRRVSRKRR